MLPFDSDGHERGQHQRHPQPRALGVSRVPVGALPATLPTTSTPNTPLDTSSTPTLRRDPMVFTSASAQPERADDQAATASSSSRQLPLPPSFLVAHGARKLGLRANRSWEHDCLSPPPRRFCGEKLPLGIRNLPDVPPTWLQQLARTGSAPIAISLLLSSSVLSLPSSSSSSSSSASASASSPHSPSFLQPADALQPAAQPSSTRIRKGDRLISAMCTSSTPLLLHVLASKFGHIHMGSGATRTTSVVPRELVQGGAPPEAANGKLGATQAGRHIHLKKVLQDPSVPAAAENPRRAANVAEVHQQ
eukprot:CAMPEP_0206430664 /NCGR_PEP_ID=MMETSP0324_2-20121206/6941_1 /ASSEMBLY_ACC=CAM_ASM_000836 /TAXON_ID=2866 /ORGANISM="Crypthecodinium cohnii, Strain Seligo" /LENGTH=305 /DNA_ID=CAMNT_0053896519 /DNA_START=83 /DNA_END=999 /DNA_ORIENTATION=-